MMDLPFNSYENYFATANHQVMEVNLAQNVEYDEMSSIHYLNNVACDSTPLSQTISVDQRHQQENLFNYMPNAHEEQPQKIDSMNRPNSSNVLSNMGSTGNVFGNIPFVQIHTTNVHPQRTSYGNVFRRNVSKQEIKSEPIKSENAEAAKDRTNATPTPPRATNQAQNETNMEAIVTSDKQPTSITNNNAEEKSKSVLQIYKCSQCPFISLRQSERDAHLSSEHGNSSVSKPKHRQPINCLGCSNVFFSKQSLELHLELDHLMGGDDILKLISALSESSKTTADACTAVVDHANKIPDTAASNEPIRKSRIYLKNVDCLREPNRQPMEKTGNQFTENITSNSLQPAKSSTPKQKISIKSVDVLREPELLRRDYEIQSSNLSNFISFSSDLLINNMELVTTPLNVNSSNSYDFAQTLDNSINKTNLKNNNDNSSKCHETTQLAEKPRRAKIYVKSVESFNLMPLDPLHTTSNKAYINNKNNSASNSSQTYDSSTVHLPYNFDSSSTSSNLNSNGNFISNHNDMETFQFINTSNANTNYILDNSLFLSNNEALNENCEQIESVPFIPDTVTPTPPAPVDANFIMNKPVPTAQEQKGTLHLRTVDELNLMNKTEVQHLIAPNLDNNHSVEVLDKVNSSSLSDINLIGDDLYEDDNFKFHDLDTQMVNDWPDAYEDLAEDINCIIAEAPNENNGEIFTFPVENNTQRTNSSNFVIDAPQVSLITIRDIEELTGTANHAAIHNVTDQQNSVVEQIQDSHNLDSTEIDIAYHEPLISQKSLNESVNESNLKRESANNTPESTDTSQVTKVTETSSIKEITNKVLPANSELPPLVPVTNSSTDSSDADKTTISALSKNNIPLPPLVPVSSIIKTINKTNKSTISPLEKGRIYVANNLMEPIKPALVITATSGTSVRGRPFGSNRTRITKLKQTIGNSAEDLFSKCSVKGCAFRFKKPETVEYHRRCHDITAVSPQAMLCPECKSTEFNSWNTLHTHLWRAHQIDMELYKCELCEFKTPIFSRLVNTHAKIHFDDRNYKCEQCEKAFKNSKQLKNHRRWHRVQAEAADVAIIPKPTPTEIYRCADCGSTFTRQKSWREHCCKRGNSLLKCSICEKLMSSKSSLKLHLLTHSNGEKRYKCENCDYATNDHNAFRRHRMGHENRKMYECSFCPYKSVQSFAYQKHVLQKHPEEAVSVIHKCTWCSYTTINRSRLAVHLAKHEEALNDRTKIKCLDENSTIQSIEKIIPVNTIELQKSKIKVKSNLFITNASESNNDVNVVQLCNTESDGVT